MQPAHAAYNDTLAHLRDIDRKLADEKRQRFADVHTAMVDAIQKANATLGPKFDDSFAKLQRAVAAKQAFETFMIKQIATDFRTIPDIGTDRDVEEAARTITGKLLERWNQLDKEARDHVKPVRHTLVVESVL